MTNELYGIIDIEEKKISSNFIQTIEAILKDQGTIKRDREFFKEIYGLGCEEKTKKEIADREGLSYERIRQIQNKLEFRIRRYLRQNPNQADLLFD